ncbi:MAG: redox-regulated ATPase YchF [Deltaproteobacteria bacterium]|nr:MAG: redox-regulated ATPase YchF [Deltaproteobacteria bacterium]
MKLGIVGLPQSGKSTIFAALTGARGEDSSRRGPRADQKIATVKVADERVDTLTKIYKPKKSTYAQVEYLLSSEISGSPSKSDDLSWNQVRVCDALIHVVRNFRLPGGIEPDSEADFWRLEEEMILSDMVVVEKRIERLEAESKKGKKPDKEEYTLLNSARELLDKGQPLRSDPALASAHALKGFTFLSAKPELVVINNDDEDEATPEWKLMPENIETIVVRGRLEMDIASMTKEEAEEFLDAYHIEESALDRVIRSSYKLLNLISFFTVLGEEVRAWTIKAGSTALMAAGTVHTDMEKGFIRAEVLPFDELIKHGSFHEARHRGLVRLEGKEYIVKDGDIINFRFNI